MSIPLAFLLAALQSAPAAQPSRIVSGIVEDPSGGAIVGASVSVTCGSETGSTTSDTAGGFEVKGLPAGRCAVIGTSELFAPTTVEVDLSRRSSVYVRLVLVIRGFEAEVVVTPARGEQEQSFDVPEAVSVTTREELESRPHQILPQVLREEPGILVQQTTTAQGSPFIRGFSAQRIVFLLDGVRFNTSTFRAGATQYLGWINPAIVQRLEVVRGPASVQYGSDALGGTINVLSLRPPLSPTGMRLSGSVEGLFGSADLSGGVDATALVQMPSAAFRIGGSGRRVNDLRPGRGRDSHSAVTRFLGLPSSVIDTRLPETSFTQAGGYFAGTLELGPTESLHSVYLHEEQSGVSRYDRLLGGDGLYRSEFDPQRLDFALVRYERAEVGFLDSLTGTFSINRQQDDRLEQAQSTSHIEREQGRVTAYGYQAQARQRLGAAHVATFGGEIYDEYIGTARVLEDPVTRARTSARPEIPDDTRYTSLGVFLQDISDVIPGRLSVRGGVRYGRFGFSTRRDAQLGVDEEEVTVDAATFHAGALLRLSSSLNATLTASRGFRAANAFDLGAIGISGGGFEISPSGAAGLGAEIGTNDGTDAVGTGTQVKRLGPEALYAFEGGVKYRTDRLAASLAVFDLDLVDAIQRRTAIFPSSIVGTTIAGYAVVAQDSDGRAFVAADPRPIVTRVNIDRARIAGFELDGQFRMTPEWIASGFFAMTNGHELGTGSFLRRMPPPLGGLRLKWEPTTRGVWLEGIATFARPQTRLSAGDLSDARIGARRSRSTIASFFNGTATDLGLVRSGVLVATGEALAEVQDRVLGSASAAPLYTRTPGFFVLGARGGWRFGPRVDLTVIAENLTDRNYRLHGSGVDAPGFNLQLKTRYRF